MLKSYFIYLPSDPGNLYEEWEQCRSQIIATWSAGKRPLKLNVFVDQPDHPSYLEAKDKIGKSVIESFGKQCPAFNVTVHIPERPWKVTAEALFIETDKSEITTKFWQEVP